jgi:transcriptional regulator with XRE-family HTH domain
MNTTPRKRKTNPKTAQPSGHSYLWHVRNRLGLSQVQFAALIGVAPNTYARFERGVLGMRSSTARLIDLVSQQAHAPKQEKE